MWLTCCDWLRAGHVMWLTDCDWLKAGHVLFNLLCSVASIILPCTEVLTVISTFLRPRIVLVLLFRLVNKYIHNLVYQSNNILWNINITMLCKFCELLFIHTIGYVLVLFVSISSMWGDRALWCQRGILEITKEHAHLHPLLFIFTIYARIISILIFNELCARILCLDLSA